MDSIVTRPSHYTKWVIEPITFIMRNKMEFWRGNIIKYAARAGSKLYDGMDEVQSEIADLEKVRRYAEMRINELKGEEVL
ncbi:kinase [Paracoccus phage ParKuw1]|uniref:Kinase n=1 Tax=Paracoccus phage ParKuw1 TaxID=3032415 RepID=A0AAF0JQ58_9CAUD|nr:kinase [Paracoccus phage ParKuw1]